MSSFLHELVLTKRNKGELTSAAQTKKLHRTEFNRASLLYSGDLSNPTLLVRTLRSMPFRVFPCVRSAIDVYSAFLTCVNMCLNRWFQESVKESWCITSPLLILTHHVVAGQGWHRENGPERHILNSVLWHLLNISDALSH